MAGRIPLLVPEERSLGEPPDGLRSGSVIIACFCGSRAGGVVRFVAVYVQAVESKGG